MEQNGMESKWIRKEKKAKVRKAEVKERKRNEKETK